MYLKSIEIQGFKSFANRIKFEFPDGITGIVGPNGSGKSNVADAVRWVLGEQKVKQLRGAKMEDVIFAGTAARKPMGYAFVALTMDNSDHKLKLDFDEITVSRRVYRSGESEYMINGSVCRLRDVQELFYDTGIGKEGYSVIGQGQIDKILQGKPEERRELFDEAAGIVKYKKRKTIALRKLESERVNLSRINDILSELGRQVGPLRRQSETAKKFLNYRDELKVYDINLFLLENGDIKEKIADCRNKEVIAANDLEAANAELEKLKEGYEKLNEDLQQLDSQIETVRSRIAQGNIVRESMAGQINVLNEQINSARDAQAHYKERLDSVTASISRAADEITRLQGEKASNQEALTAAVDAANAEDSLVLDIQGKIEDVSREIEELKEKLIDNVNAKGDINARIERLNVLSEQSQKRREELAGTLEQYASDKETQERIVAGLQSEYDEVLSDTQAAEGEVRDKETRLKQADADAAFAERDLGKSREELAKASALLESVKNLTERYEGYGSSIREVMKLKEREHGIHGVVADIIRVDKKYETAIETALGGNIQNIVTDTETTAKKAIEYLKTNKLGRATFLPIKAVTGRGEFKNDEVLSQRGVLGLASALVDVDPQYTGVVNYLLGKIVVADNIDNALALARKYSYSLIIVTLEGELLNRGGALSGGAFRNKSNLLGRRREIEELEKTIEANKKKQESLKLRIEAAGREKENLEKELLEARTLLQESRIRLNTVKINLEQAHLRSQEITRNFEGINNERRRIEEQAGSMASENDALRDALEDNAAENEKIKGKIAGLQGRHEELKGDEARELLKRQTMNADKSRLLGQNSVISEALTKLEGDLALLKEEQEKINRGSQGSEDDIAAHLEEIAGITASIELADAECAALGVKLKEHESAREEWANAHKDYLESREACQNRINDLDKEVFRLSQQREKLEERFETKSEYMWNEYELTYQSALELRKEELTDVREMREKIAQLKSDIKGLGTINVGAIEEYREVGERYEQMKAQQEDLSKAEEDLLKIIRELDKEMRRQFNAEFGKIQAEFGKVFREMFGGGQGTIELEENIDVLDAGISIIAQPPGKKLQNMMQLSGGEKALTAIAVLFAIQNLKPSPFCLLDEIEAALDDSNIERFAEYVHKLTDETQFIVITHRKGTMEAADRLYGITMQEKGVSTLISVNLADYNEEEMK